MPYKKRKDLNKKREGSTKKKTRVRGHWRGLPYSTGSEIGIVGFFLFLCGIIYGFPWLEYQFETHPLISWSVTVGCLLVLGGIMYILLKRGNK